MKFKDVLVMTSLITLTACGGSSGGSGEPSEDGLRGDPATSEPVPPPGVAGGLYKATTENYVAVASALYSGTVAVAALSGAAQGLQLFEIAFASQTESVNACATSGRTVTKIVRLPFEERTVHGGDKLERLYQGCADGSGTVQDGQTNISVKSLSGEYGNDYVVRIDDRHNLRMTQSSNSNSNGDYSHYLPSVHAKEGEVRLIGIDLARLYSGELPDTGAPDFTEVVAEEISAGGPVANAPHHETPTGRFDTFAFELITDESGEHDRTKMRWPLDVKNKLDASGNHVTRTVRQLILEDGPDPEDGESTKVALEGEFVFEMNTGGTIRIEVFPPDSAVTPGTSAAQNVVVYFDAESDGVMDAHSGMTWDAFQSAMFGLMAGTAP